MMSSGFPEEDREGGHRRAELGRVPIISRRIPIDINGGDDPAGKDAERFTVTVWETYKPVDFIWEWWLIYVLERKARIKDLSRLVMWPGYTLVLQELMRQQYLLPATSALMNATVLVLGSGTVVEAQTAAFLGAKKVVETDINPLTLKLLEYSAQEDNQIGRSV